jgi:hypothetical protein
MRRLIHLAVLCCIFTPVPALAECADAAIHGDVACRYARRVVREESLSEARKYSKKAEEAAQAAMDVAEECDYDEAAGAFFHAARHAGAALKADDLAGIKEQAREMMRFCEEGIRAAEQFR